MTRKQALERLLSESEDFTQAIEFLSLLQNNGMNDTLSRQERNSKMEEFISSLSRKKIGQISDLLLDLEKLLNYDL